MGLASCMIDAIANDFLIPTVERLGKQLGRNIHLDVRLKIEGESAERQLTSDRRAGFDCLRGEARIAASETAVSDKYKYNLQCVFDEDPRLEGFSGIRVSGTVTSANGHLENQYSGFLYSYNEWSWGKRLRDF